MQESACVNDRTHVLRGVLVAATEGAGQGIDDDQHDGLPDLLLELPGDINDASGCPGVAEIVDATADGEGEVSNPTALAECQGTPLDQLLAFERNVEHRSPPYLATVPGPARG